MEILMERRPRGPRAPRVADETWEEHKDKVRELYLVRGRTLEEVMAEMLSKHGFSSSKRQYTLQLKKWGFFKNGPNAIKAQGRPSTSEIQIGHPALPPIDVDSMSIDGDLPPLIRDEELASISHGVASLSNPGIGSLLEEGLPESINEMTVTIDELTKTPVSTFGSHSLSSGGGDGNSLTNTSSATILSSRSSIEQNTDTAIIRPASSHDGNVVICESKKSRQGKTPSLSPSQNQAEVTSDDTDISMPDSEQTPIDTITNRPISIVGFLPTFYVPSPSLRKTSPMIFLQNAALLEQTLRPITRDDLCQIERLGEALHGSSSYEDTFRLFRVFLMQTMAQSLGVAQRFPLVLQGLVSLTRNASTGEHRSEVLEILKCVTPKELKLHSEYAAQGCLLYAFLGNCLRHEGQLGLAEKYCSLALHSYHSMKLEHRCPAHQAIIVESLALVIEDRELRDWQNVVDSRVYSLRLQRCGRLDSSVMHAVNNHLFNMFKWCHNLLTDPSFMTEMRAVVGTLLQKSRTLTLCANFYSTILFSLLWKRAEEKETPSCPLGDASPTFVDRPSSLSSLEIWCGTSPVESLSAITRMITSSLESFEHPGVFDSLVQVTLNIEKRWDLRTVEAFLGAHVAPLNGGDQYASPKSLKIMETFTRELMETNFDLRLSENAFQDPRIRQNLYRGSFAPSLTSTMLSTPRSSWGMLSSGTSVSRGISLVLESNGEPERAISNPRWSQMSSVLSLATSASSRLSARISVKRNSIISDREEPNRPMRGIGQHKISSPILISTTNTQVLDSRFLGSGHRVDPGGDPMDIDWNIV